MRDAPRSDLALLRRLAAERPDAVDPWQEWREANLHRLAVEAHLRDCIGTIERLHTELRARDVRLRELETAAADHARALDAWRDRAAVAEARARDRDAKVRQMQHSASWRLTAPLRALRRALIDPWRRAAPAAAPNTAAFTPAEPAPPAAVPETEPPAPAPLPAEGRLLDPRFAFRVDHPRSWRIAREAVTVVGWCFRLDRADTVELRYRLGADTLGPIETGLRRTDVFATHRHYPAAERSGFRFNLRAPGGRHPLAVEARDPVTGEWIAIWRHEPAFGVPPGPEDLSEYERWLADYHALAPHDEAAIRKHVAHLAYQPTISVLVPVYNPPERWLRRAIESVRAQLYPHWELCLADDASTAPHVRAVLAEAAAADPRVKVVHRERNGHISAASNSALALATGAFVALLDHDDELASHALYEVAVALNDRRDAALVYTDEDKIDEEGRRYEPYFKPEWDPELLTGQNFLAHLVVYRTDLVRAVGGFREGYEGSQDWDLALRVTERLDPARVVHIPKPLYHWRAIAGSTALAPGEKNYPAEAARRALADHFARRGIAATLEPVPGDQWRVRWPLPTPPPLVSVVIPTRNALELVRRCVESLRARTTYPHWELILVDNGSDDPATLAWLETQAARTHTAVLRDARPFNYAALNNLGAARARGEVLAFLNNDLEALTPDWLEEMVSRAVRPGTGAVGALLYYPDDTVQHAGVILGLGGVAGHLHKHLPRGVPDANSRIRVAQSMGAVTGACLVVRRDAFERVGGFDAEHLAVAFNDVDLCLRLRALGLRHCITPFAEFYHHESATRGNDDTPAKQARFAREVDYMQQTWGLLLRDDPAYNPNLRLEGEESSLARPPRIRRPWLRPLA